MRAPLDTLFRKSNLNFKNHSRNVKLLWECCQIQISLKVLIMSILTSFLKFFPFYLQNTVKLIIMDEAAPNNLDNYEGNIDSLANRISYVRTGLMCRIKVTAENADYWIAKIKDMKITVEKLHEELSKSFGQKNYVLSKGLEQDIQLNTKILDDNKIYINDHFIGKINGLKIELNYSNQIYYRYKILKAARSGAQEELTQRINYIINNLSSLEQKDDYKIYWNDKKIAELKPGKTT